MSLLRRHLGWTIAEEGKSPCTMAPVFDRSDEGRAKAERCAAGATERTGRRHVVVEEWSAEWESEEAAAPVGHPRGIGSCSARVRHRPATGKHASEADPVWGAWPGPENGRRVEPRRRAD